MCGYFIGMSPRILPAFIYVVHAQCGSRAAAASVVACPLCSCPTGPMCLVCVQAGQALPVLIGVVHEYAESGALLCAGVGVISKWFHCSCMCCLSPRTYFVCTWDRWFLHLPMLCTE